MFILGQQESEDGYLPVEILLHTLHVRRMDHDIYISGPFSTFTATTIKTLRVGKGNYLHPV